MAIGIAIVHLVLHKRFTGKQRRVKESKERLKYKGQRASNRHILRDELIDSYGILIYIPKDIYVYTKIDIYLYKPKYKERGRLQYKSGIRGPKRGSGMIGRLTSKL